MVAPPKIYTFDQQSSENTVNLKPSFYDTFSYSFQSLVDQLQNT